MPTVATVTKQRLSKSWFATADADLFYPRNSALIRIQKISSLLVLPTHFAVSCIVIALRTRTTA